MAQYDSFARFYDAVNGEPEELVTRILDYVHRYAPNATSILELGCGTGAVLSGLGSGFTLTGIDLSPSMLARARRRCREARLVLGDITSFSLDETFDVVICVFDTLNHVTSLEGWRAVFARVASHLSPGGLFVFDVITVGRLRDLDESAAWVYDFDGNTLIMSVDFADEPLARWNIRVFEGTGGDVFELHHEIISELGVALDDVRALLAGDFEILDSGDVEGGPASDNSERALFAVRRR